MQLPDDSEGVDCLNDTKFHVESARTSERSVGDGCGQACQGADRPHGVMMTEQHQPRR